MKKVYCIVSRKALYTIGVFILILMSIFLIFFRIKSNHVSKAFNLKPTEELYKQMTNTLLMPSITEAVDNYYKDYLKVSPTVEPWSIEILKAEKTKDHTYEFLVEIKVAPFIGPHNSVGMDCLTFRVKPWGEVILEKYDHIKSNKIAPNWSDIIIKWPPD